MKSFISIIKTAKSLSKRRWTVYLCLQICFYLNSFSAFSQTGPQIQLEKLDATCSGNGQIKASLTGAEGYSRSDFSLYLLPEEGSTLAESKDGVFTNLQPGSYIVKATLENDDESKELSAEISVESGHRELSFSVRSYNLCQSEFGSIEIIVNSGVPHLYQIDGPVTRAPQENPVFENLPEGSYTVVVTDECGDRLSQTFQIQNAEFVIDNQRREFKSELEACGEIMIGHYIRAVGSTIEYPLQMIFEVTDPYGEVQQYQTVIQDGEGTEGFIYGKIPFFPGEAYSYNLTVIDNCGEKATLQNNLVDRDFKIADDLLWGAGMCGKRRLSIKPLNFFGPFTITFTKSPEGFDPAVYNEEYPGPFTEDNVYFGTNDLVIPVGEYEMEVTDACGRTAIASTYYWGGISRPVPLVFKGCGEDNGSLQLNSYDFEYTKVEMIEGPVEFSSTYPIDLSHNISQSDRRRFFMNNLPAGDYKFQVNTSCDDEVQYITEATIEGPIVSKNEIEIIENCGSFNLSLIHEDNLSSDQNVRFGLQKLNPETGEWGHPLTGAEYTEGTEINSRNAVILTNHAMNINLGYHGELRVVKSILIWKNGSEIGTGQRSYTYCLETLETFKLRERSIFTDINSFSCGDGNYEVYVSAEGYAPFTYRITSKNSEEFLIDNGDDQLFKNLQAGIYQLQLEDRCGNITNATINLRGENLPRIVPDNLCEGENGTLHVPNLKNIQFEWYKDDEPDRILSTGPVLEFTPFNLETHEGLYKVRLLTDNPDACLNEVLEFRIDESRLNPEPGTGQAVELCQGEIVNLFDFLEGPYNDYGTWEEITSNDALIGNTWSSVGLSPGTYEFVYTISGICSGENSANVIITLKEAPPVPTGEILQEFCGPGTPTVADLVVDGENIQWYLTPSGGESLAPNHPLVTGNKYYAAQMIDGCVSTDRLNIEVILYDPVSQADLQADQVLYQMEIPDPILGELPQGGSGRYTYKWQKNTGSKWEDIEGAVEHNYQPDPLMESTSFRRIIIDELCGEYISNVVTITIEVAEISATNDSFGPLKGYEDNILESILENDLYTGAPVLPDQVLISIDRIRDQNGNESDLLIEVDDQGIIRLPKGTTPGHYAITYTICQASVPENCSSAIISIWVGRIEMDITKKVDRTAVIEGEIITYSISLVNKSPFSLDRTIVEDILPKGLLLISSSLPPQNGLIWVLNSLEQEESFEVQLDVMAVNEGILTNEVRIQTGDLDTLVQSEPVAVRPKSADLVASKNSFGREILDGDEFIYEIRVENKGPDEASNVQIRDILPYALYYKNMDYQVSDTDMEVTFENKDNQLIWHINTFPVGASITINLTVTADDEGRITNRVIASSDEKDINPDDNIAIDHNIIKPIFIPNVIKPDNDGKNDSFVLRLSHKYNKVGLLIFNRWGDVVFTSDDYKNDWSAEGLNGGTYYYQIKGTNQRGQEKQYKGWLQVIKN